MNIDCQTFGDAEDGKFGTTLVWGKLDDGTYVSDAYIFTNTNGLVTSVCQGPATGYVSDAWISTGDDTAKQTSSC